MKCKMNGNEVAMPCVTSCALFGDCVAAYQRSLRGHKPTNADRIHAMSDEELADWLLWMQTNDISVQWCCKPECYARIERLGDEFDCTDIMVKACAVDWLKKPAEEE